MAEPSPQTKELGEKLLAAIKGYVARAINTRVAELQIRVDKWVSAAESAERRLSRHADHLSRLESRLQSLEHQAKK